MAGEPGGGTHYVVSGNTPLQNAQGRVFQLPVLVAFGDCDPAGIVFYPNYYRWFDLATHQMWRAAGIDVAAWKRERGLVIGPLVDTGAKFRATATHGDILTVNSQVVQWSEKTFGIQHRVVRDDTLLVEGWEVRIIAQPQADNPARIRAVPIPEEFRKALS